LKESNVVVKVYLIEILEFVKI